MQVIFSLSVCSMIMSTMDCYLPCLVCDYVNSRRELCLFGLSDMALFFWFSTSYESNIECTQGTNSSQQCNKLEYKSYIN